MRETEGNTQKKETISIAFHLWNDIAILVQVRGLSRTTPFSKRFVCLLNLELKITPGSWE